jgi:hypothetical protein
MKKVKLGDAGKGPKFVPNDRFQFAQFRFSLPFPIKVGENPFGPDIDWKRPQIRTRVEKHASRNFIAYPRKLPQMGYGSLEIIFREVFPLPRSVCDATGGLMNELGPIPEF